MPSQKIIVATRKSALALAQSRQFLARLVQLYPGTATEELHVVTTGDQVLDRPLAEIGGKGLFLKEIEEKLLDGSASMAVHSLKDVPPLLHPGLVLACIPPREDPRDVLVTRDGRPFAELARGAKLGTSSLRRAVQLQALRPDLVVVPLRGNVGTRIAKCKNGEVDATVLAMAGLLRLGLEHEISDILSVDQCLPAVGQGALAIEVRIEDKHLSELLGPLACSDTTVISAAERGVMTAVEGDCKTPVAAYGERHGDELYLRALLARPDGTALRRAERRVAFPASSAEAQVLGLELGQELKG